jgi:methylmalonyl-CoA mutase N-terminal domain/subunit
VRVTLQALAAVLGGAQSLHTNSKDEALALPQKDAARLALRTQQIIANESGVTNTVDPLGGSFAIEAMTDRIEKETVEYLDKIESLGGMLAAIESGFVQKEIQESAYSYQRAIETDERIIVGVNRFQSEEKERIPIHKVDPDLEASQIEKLRALRGSRDAAAVSAALASLEDAARGDRNLMPLIIDAVRVYASVGEISDALRRVFGEYHEAVTV